MPIRNRPVSHRALAHRSQRARRNPRALRNGPWDAVASIVTGGVSSVYDDLNLTKKQKYTNALEKESLFRTRYLSCKQKHGAAAVYPQGKKCKKKYKNWQKWQSKKSELAKELGEKLESKGQLHPALEAQLIEDQVVVSDPESVSSPVTSPVDIPETELEGETALPAMPWLALGGAAAVGTLALIFLLRR